MSWYLWWSRSYFLQCIKASCTGHTHHVLIEGARTKDHNLNTSKVVSGLYLAHHLHAHIGSAHVWHSTTGSVSVSPPCVWSAPSVLTKLHHNYPSPTQKLYFAVSHAFMIIRKLPGNWIGKKYKNKRESCWVWATLSSNLSTTKCQI